MITAEPNSEYNGLRRQFLSLRTLANAQAKTITHLRERLDALAACNNAAELESQREANAQLTHDVAILEAKLEAGAPAEQSLGVLGQYLHEHRDALSAKAANYEAGASVKRDVLYRCQLAFQQVERLSEPQLQCMTQAIFKILCDTLCAELIHLSTTDLTVPFTPIDIDKERTELEQQAVSNFIQILTASGQFDHDDITFIRRFCQIHIGADPLERIALISAANYLHSLQTK